MVIISKRKAIKIIDEEIGINKNYLEMYLDKMDEPGCSKETKIYCDVMTDNYHGRILTLLALRCRFTNEL